MSAPLVGVAGAAAMLPLGIVTTASIALAVAAFTAMRTRTAASATSAPDPATPRAGQPARGPDAVLTGAGAS
jgi:DHA1 family bicyclomycin/chloramphenicol resistance-like MFS transporter